MRNLQLSKMICETLTATFEFKINILLQVLLNITSYTPKKLKKYTITIANRIN